MKKLFSRRNKYEVEQQKEARVAERLYMFIVVMVIVTAIGLIMAGPQIMDFSQKKNNETISTPSTSSQESSP